MRFSPSSCREEVIASLVRAGNEMADLLRRMVKGAAAGIPQDDFISELIRAEDGSDRMLDGEIVLVQAIVHHCCGLLETTIGLIGNGTRALIEASRPTGFCFVSDRI